MVSMKSEFDPLDNCKLQLPAGRRSNFLMILEFIRPIPAFDEFDGYPIGKEAEDQMHDLLVREWQIKLGAVCLNCGFNFKWVD